MQDRAFGVSQRRAFTLIELLVVMSIIALLIGILLPALRKVCRQAKSMAAMNDQKEVLLLTSAVPP